MDNQLPRAEARISDLEHELAEARSLITQTVKWCEEQANEIDERAPELSDGELARMAALHSCAARLKGEE